MRALLLLFQQSVSRRRQRLATKYKGRWRVPSHTQYPHAYRVGSFMETILV